MQDFPLPPSNHPLSPPAERNLSMDTTPTIAATSPKKRPYTPPTIAEAGTIEQMTRGTEVMTSDAGVLGSAG